MTEITESHLRCGSTDIGQVPWTRGDMIAAVPCFKELYAQRPIKKNHGGMRASHAFLTWFYLRELKPTLIVESGVWRGQGTWLIEQACPDADVLCLDPTFSQLIYKSQRAEYSTTDFSLTNMSAADPEATLCFFDDHQNALTRLQQMRWKGLRWAIFDDNYPPSDGNCYSLKQALSGSGFDMPKRDVKAGDFKDMVRAAADTLVRSVPANATHASELRQRLRTYYEGPPLLQPQVTSDCPTKPPLLEANHDSDLGLEADPYIFMCLVELAS